MMEPVSSSSPPSYIAVNSRFLLKILFSSYGPDVLSAASDFRFTFFKRFFSRFSALCYFLSALSFFFSSLFRPANGSTSFAVSALFLRFFTLTSFFSICYTPAVSAFVFRFTTFAGSASSLSSSSSGVNSESESETADSNEDS